MTLLNPACFDEIIGSLRRDGVEVHHFCLVAGNEVLRRTAVRRDATGWAEPKYDEYEDAIRDDRFARHLDAVTLDAAAIAATIGESLSLLPHRRS